MDNPQAPITAPAAGTFLDVPGARLYYETIGAGPLLLLIPGANGDANIFMPMSRPAIAIQVEVIIRPALYRPGW